MMRIDGYEDSYVRESNTRKEEKWLHSKNCPEFGTRTVDF
jgi:hypothetical protein